jgi:FkbM family methyltransferase
LRHGQTPLILDLGANIGASAVWFAVRYPAAHIVAFEPHPDN